MKVSEGNIPKKRDVKFDGLRVIGLLAIILAHVNPPALIFQLRNFDVPLMVLVSGAVYGLSSSKKKYLSYIWGRVLRLLTPTWTFLVIFFLLNLLLGHQFSLQDIINSFALLNGIGYVWIIRVFILVAIIAPFFVYLYRKIQNKLWYLLMILLVFVCYSSLLFLYTVVPFLHTNSAINFIFQNIIFYMLPFGCVAGFGMYMLHATKKSIFFLFTLFTGFFLCLAYIYSVHQFVPTQAYKYPPELYYLSYALSASLLLYFVSLASIFQSIFGSRLMQFITASSLWIYLWQIFFLYQWNYLRHVMPKWLDTYLFEYVFIVAISVFVTFAQKRIITEIVRRVKNQAVQSVLSIALLK